MAFDGGEQLGVNHMDVTLVATAEGSTDRTEKPAFRFASRGPSGKMGFAFPLVVSYLVETLACFMPREPDACFHYRAVEDGSGAVGPAPSALFAVGEEVVEVDGKTVLTFKYDVWRNRRTLSTSWVRKDGHVVRSDYGGTTRNLSTKEAALDPDHTYVLEIRIPHNRKAPRTASDR